MMIMSSVTGSPRYAWGIERQASALFRDEHPVPRSACSARAALLDDVDETKDAREAQPDNTGMAARDEKKGAAGIFI